MNSSSDADPPNRSPSAVLAREDGGRPARFDLVNRQRKVPISCGEIERFMAGIPSSLTGSSYTVCVVSDRVIRGYNQAFRGKPEATDVLSFPMGEGSGHEGEFLGDILISAETAARNASRFGVCLEDEIKLLILHGLLHLLGHDHERDQGQMARRERRWADRLGLPQSLLGRASRRPIRRQPVPDHSVQKRAGRSK